MSWLTLGISINTWKCLGRKNLSWLSGPTNKELYRITYDRERYRVLELVIEARMWAWYQNNLLNESYLVLSKLIGEIMSWTKEDPKLAHHFFLYFLINKNDNQNLISCSRKKIWFYIFFLIIELLFRLSNRTFIWRQIRKVTVQIPSEM